MQATVAVLVLAALCTSVLDAFIFYEQPYQGHLDKYFGVRHSTASYRMAKMRYFE